MPYASGVYMPNGYPYGFQQQMNQSNQNTNQGIIWVQGEAGAKSYLVAPNSTVMLMDSEESVFYLKSTDGAGMPMLRRFEYKETTQSVPQQLAQASQSNSKSLDEQFVTRAEYEAICGKYDELRGIVAELQKAKPTRKKEGLSDEQSIV